MTGPRTDSPRANDPTGARCRPADDPARSLGDTPPVDEPGGKPPARQRTPPAPRMNATGPDEHQKGRRLDVTFVKSQV